MVASGVDTLTVTAGWGRYRKAEMLDDAGNPRRCWSREPVQYVRRLIRAWRRAAELRAGSESLDY